MTNAAIPVATRLPAARPDERSLARPFVRRSVELNYGFTGDGTDLESCTASIQRGSKSFHIASLMLPRKTRQAAHALYAFCRHSDDMIDDTGRGPDALERLRQRLDLIYQGAPADHACDRAFARIVHDHAVPKGIPMALLDGFAMDMEDRHYRTIGEVKDYAAGVAATVGLMMSLVMGCGDPWTLARAADLGLAMQLTNIARDVGEDARNGRLYLPQDWLHEAGIDVGAFRRRPRFSPALGLVVKRLLDEADHHYRLGHAGIEHLPADCRHAIRTAALTYQEIGHRIADNGYDSVSRRASTSLARKLALVLRARRVVRLPSALGPSLQAVPADVSVAHLVQAAAEAFAQQKLQAPQPLPGISGVERAASIMLALQARSREDRLAHRLERWQKAARLA
ncbi:phytoene/squalene synthase family protein [Rhizobium sp. CG5]|uniref:phytoene/squalene synthase family protein n=1 Tax=Rhizobium sp. CG5 TaxID=2726076 RepID=UPI002034683D|nr:phytoene/squalene synthase family protein [Rhizobium sp. CG5]MCM2472496.1 phytoene/squalene synthase family protein [Rhizobium sp. CG5]